MKDVKLPSTIGTSWCSRVVKGGGLKILCSFASRVRIPPPAFEVIFDPARLAQSVERTPFKRVVAGSSPAVGVVCKFICTR